MLNAEGDGINERAVSDVIFIEVRAVFQALENGDTDYVGGVMIAINLYSIRHELAADPQRTLQKIEAAGFDAVELYLSPDLPPPETMKTLMFLRRATTR
jgi:hypothetical protein